MESISVFCGSSLGSDPVFSEVAYAVGGALAKDRINVVYGGAKIGLMGKVADGALHAGGKVTGVIPTFLKTKEVAHEELSQMIEVETMHERKMKMHELSDGIIVLPGGFGTMEEFFEISTWAQLGLHEYPIGLLNVNGFYDSLIELLDVMIEKDLLKTINKKMIVVSHNVDDLLLQMKNYQAPKVKKWISSDKT